MGVLLREAVSDGGQCLHAVLLLGQLRVERRRGAAQACVLAVLHLLVVLATLLTRHQVTQVLEYNKIKVTF